MGVPFSYTVTTSGYVSPALSETGALPAGVTFVDDGNGTAVLSGTVASGSKPSYTVTVTATSISGTTSRLLTLDVETTPTITSPSIVSVSTGVRLAFHIESTGWPRPVVTESGALPAGITFRPLGHGRAELTGTATASGSWPVTLTATNAAGSGSQGFTVVVQ